MASCQSASTSVQLASVSSRNRPKAAAPRHAPEPCRDTVAKNDIHWNPINQWIDESKEDNYDTLHLYALDHLSCPTMATQYERAFSTARRTLTPERNALRLNSSRLVNVYGGDGSPRAVNSGLDDA
jgi:hypothetical protein